MVEDSGRITIDNVCSECGQNFSPATKICPNDGTRLTAPQPEKTKGNGGSKNSSSARAENGKVGKKQPQSTSGTAEKDAPNLKLNTFGPADTNPHALSVGSLFAQALREEPEKPAPKQPEEKASARVDNDKQLDITPELANAETVVCDSEAETIDTSMLVDEDGEPANFAREAAQKQIGKIVNGQYKILSAIGYGGMSVVYRAKDLKLGKFVAVKMLLPHLMLQNHSMQRFHQEAQSASALNHPNVVGIHNFGETDSGQPFLVMDLIEGTSLSTLIKREGHLTVDRALNIFIQLTSALTHAHEKGIVHRDLKPSNVLLTEQNGQSDVCKIVDFGIAKLLPHEGRDAVSLTQTGDVFGSPLYMSPEQCKGEKLDAKADVYSMGCLMYETLSGTPPHTGNNMLEVLYRHMNEVPKDFKSLKMGLQIPQRLEAAIYKALAKDPANRQTMQALNEDLKQLALYRKSTLWGRLATSWELFVLRRRPRKRSEFIMLGALSVSLLALFAACAFLVTQYVFSDESQVFKQAFNWRVKEMPPPTDIGATAVTIYQNSLDESEQILKTGATERGTTALEQMTIWASKMAAANHWEDAAKSYGIALELSKRYNGELCLPTLSLSRKFAEASYYAKDYAFAAREFTLYQQHIKDFLYGETVGTTMDGIFQLAESYYYLNDYSAAVTAYRNFFASMHGDGLDWTHWSSHEIGKYMKRTMEFQNTKEFALLLSHYGDCLKKLEVFPKAKECYRTAAARWTTLKVPDNAALADLKKAETEQLLNEDPQDSFESALTAVKKGGSPFATCMVEKEYSDYLWKHGDALKSLWLKLDYSRQVTKVKFQ